MTETRKTKPEWVIPFGKHKGKSIKQIPTSYLEFLTEQAWFLEKFRPAAVLIGKELTLRNSQGDDDGSKEDRMFGMFV